MEGNRVLGNIAHVIKVGAGNSRSRSAPQWVVGDSLACMLAGMRKPMFLSER